MVFEQDIPRVQSFGKQIPTEVYGVLRMFDGYRVLADVLEDSPYRVFETLRVAHRALRARTCPVAHGARGDGGPSASGARQDGDSGPTARDSGPIARDARGKVVRKPRRKKK